MKIEKKIIGNLTKCYSIANLNYKGEHCFLVAAEKQDPCYLFQEDGTKIEQVWDGPGGVMTMVQVPGSDGTFLATRKFYGPNDGAEASIIIASPSENGAWEIRTLCNVPFVHRFGILNRGGVNYLIACCLKSGHEYKNDWRFAGETYGAVLPDDLSQFDDSNQLQMSLLMDDMLKNHGFSICQHGGHDAALVGCEEGSFLFDPPMVPGGDWTITKVLDIPSSDSVLMDFDGDGKMELGVISDFHGNSLSIYHLNEHGHYIPQWNLPIPEKDTEMLHATWADTILGKPTWVVGWRKGTKDTIAITWDENAGDYHVEYLDKNTGCANAMHFVNKNGQNVIIGTNREIDEIAMYIVTE
jgi:hypothetical protein